MTAKTHPGYEVVSQRWLPAGIDEERLWCSTLDVAQEHAQKLIHKTGIERVRILNLETRNAETF